MKRVKAILMTMVLVLTLCAGLTVPAYAEDQPNVTPLYVQFDDGTFIAYIYGGNDGSSEWRKYDDFAEEGRFSKSQGEYFADAEGFIYEGVTVSKEIITGGIAFDITLNNATIRRIIGTGIPGDIQPKPCTLNITLVGKNLVGLQRVNDLADMSESAIKADYINFFGSGEISAASRKDVVNATEDITFTEDFSGVFTSLRYGFPDPVSLRSGGSIKMKNGKIQAINKNGTAIHGEKGVTIEEKANVSANSMLMGNAISIRENKIDVKTKNFSASTENEVIVFGNLEFAYPEMVWASRKQDPSDVNEIEKFDMSHKEEYRWIKSQENYYPEDMTEDYELSTDARIVSLPSELASLFGLSDTEVIIGTTIGLRTTKITNSVTPDEKKMFEETANGRSIADYYDICPLVMSPSDGSTAKEVHELNGMLKIEIANDKVLATDKVTVYGLHNGKIEECPTESEAGKIRFLSRAYSTFAIVVDDVATTPDTGDNSGIVWFAVLMFASAVLCGTSFARRKRV